MGRHFQELDPECFTNYFHTHKLPIATDSGQVYLKAMKLFRNYFQRPVAVTQVQSTTTEEPQGKEEEYTFDVVGESFQRDHLVQLIKKHNLTDSGELYTTATLKLEPENAFDSTAVMVIVEDLQVGYIPKSFSGEMTDYIKAKGGKTLQVPARVGWDRDSPQPLVGVRLKMEDF